MMKIKVSFGSDLRLFKYEGASLSEAFDALTAFVTQTFGVEVFRLQYRDEENDLVTIVSEHELDEAFDLAMEQGKTLKLFVVAAVAQQATEPIAEDVVALEEDVMEEKEEVATATATEEEAEVISQEACGPKLHDLGELLVEDEGFRQEFAAFAQDVVLQLREGDNFETAVHTGLASHDELAAHPFVRDHLIGMLPFVAERAQLAVPFLMKVEPTTVPGLIDQVVEGIRSGGGAHNPLLGGGFPFGPGGPFGCSPSMSGLGGMPWFGGGFGPHGHPHAAPPAGEGGCPAGGFGALFGRGHRGRHGHGHGHGGHGHHGHGRGRGRGRPCGRKGKHSVYRMDVVDPHVTLADKAVVLPSSSVVKTWRIRNTGEEAFPEGTKLKYVGRPFNQLVDGVEFPVDALDVGEEGEVSILLSTPANSGRFGSAWRLELPDGTPFGQMLRARVVVAMAMASEEFPPSGSGSDDEDDMADIYDNGVATSKKERKLNKLLAKRAKLEGQLAKLGGKIERARGEIVVEDDDDEVAPPPPIVSALTAVEDAVVEDDPFAAQLADLESMGFTDAQLNRVLLAQNNGQLQAVLNTLCEIRG